MSVNPMAFMQMKERLDTFTRQHPKVPLFLKDVNEHAILPGTIMELTVTDPAGKRYVTNIRLTEEDVKTLRMLQSSRPSE